VGIIDTAFKRRNGVYLEVTVEHDAVDPTKHRLWFGWEVLDDIAKLREDPHEAGRFGRESLDVELFGEAVMQFLQDKGVDLADPDWGMADESIPFCHEHIPMRTVMQYYEDLPEAVVDACLKPPPEPYEPVVLKEFPEEDVMYIANPFPFGMSKDFDVTKIGGISDAEFAAADAEARKRYLEMTKTPTKLDVKIQSDDQVPSPSASVQHGDAAEEDTSGSDGPVEDVEEAQANGVAVG
jgi:hypothetical protein